jgi:hypothetical protein
MAGVTDLLKLAIPLVIGGSAVHSYMSSNNPTQALPPQPTALSPQQNSSFYEAQQDIHPYIKNHQNFMGKVTNYLSDWVNQEKPNLYEFNAVMSAISPLIEQSKYLADTAVKTAQSRAAERIHMFDTLYGGDNQTPGAANATNSATRLNQAYNIVYGNKDMDANALTLAQRLGLTQQNNPSSGTNNTQQALPGATTQSNNNDTDYLNNDWDIYKGNLLP